MRVMLARGVLLAALALAAGAYNFQQGYDGAGCLNKCLAQRSPPHGYCKGTTMQRCDCLDQWGNDALDCSERVCPAGRSWFDAPASATAAHTTQTPCSNKGQCNYATGNCDCGEDFEGAACNRLRCPGFVNGRPCNGHGRCATVREAGMLRPTLPRVYERVANYSGWDGDMIQGCVCDAGWTGYDCSVPVCPLGSDPLYSGNLEVQRIRTSGGTRVNEIQQVLITGSATTGGGGSGGSGDVNEVQSIVLNGTAGSPPTGSFTVTFDSTGGDGYCKVCINSAVRLTQPIALTGTPATDAALLQTELNALSNIGAGGVTVAGSLLDDVGYQFLVTFIGSDVGGDVSALQLGTGSLTGLVTAAVSQVVQGSEVAGTVVLTFDDVTTYPDRQILALNGDTTDFTVLQPMGIQTSAAIAYSAATGTVATAVGTLVQAGKESVPNAVSVTRVGTGGPGVAWRISYDRGIRIRGNVAQIDVTPSLTLTHASLTGAAATATTSTIQNGTFLSGSFPVAVSYAAPGGGTASTHTTSVAWNAAPAAMEAAINALETGYGFGAVRVSRARYYSVDQYAWSGEYDWTVTFLSLAEDVPTMPTPDASSLYAGATSTPSVSVSTITTGDATGEVNEVQLIECRCPTGACTDPTTQTIALSFMGDRTAPIPYSASAATLAAALAALPSIPAVSVSLYDQRSNTVASLCDTDGTVAAITFTHNPGPQPPLAIAVPSTDMMLPAAATFLIRSAPGFGLYGGRARRGTRVLLPCSGRGTCNTDTRTCTCSTSGVNGTSAIFGASDNGGGGVAPAAPTTAKGFPNCGLPLVNVTTCPGTDGNGVVCTGHGTCSGSPAYKCACIDGWTGPACSKRTCSTGNAWWDVPTIAAGTSSVTAHASSTCSARGLCEDVVTGKCVCGGGFRGVACELMGCPSGGTLAVDGAASSVNDTCPNGNACVTLRTYGRSHTIDATTELRTPLALAIDYATPWDANQIRGCACNTTRRYVVVGPTGAASGGGPITPLTPDGGNGGGGYGNGRVTGGGNSAHSLQRYRGWNCREYTCPGGTAPDDATALASARYEVQQIACNATAGFISFQFRNSSTRGIPWNAYVVNADAPFDYYMGMYYTLERALREINVTGAIIVSTPSVGGQLCGAGYGNGTVGANWGVASITFTSMEGDPPMLVAVPDATATGPTNATVVTVTEVVKGGIGTEPCSGHGVCNRATGQCICQPQFGDGNGLGGAGQRGDCGLRDSLFGLARATEQGSLGDAALVSTPEYPRPYP